MILSKAVCFHRVLSWPRRGNFNFLIRMASEQSQMRVSANSHFSVLYSNIGKK
jgi:hypothetical protein